MTIGIFITARLGSLRLKKKHLLPLNGYPIVYYLIKRITREFSEEISHGDVKVILTTSEEIENKEFQKLEPFGLEVFYGSDSNIPLRHLQAARKHSLDSIISVDGDDILCSYCGMREVYNMLKDGEPYVRTSYLPFGLNSFGYTRIFLEASLSENSDNVLETGWGRIFDESKGKDIDGASLSESKELRFTLDYPEDYEFFKELILGVADKIITIPDDDLVEFVLARKLNEINNKINTAYWDYFHTKRAEEDGSLSPKKTMFE